MGDSNSINPLCNFGQANDETKRSEVQSTVPGRAAYTLFQQRTNLWPGMGDSNSINPLATMSMHDNSKTRALTIHQQYQHNRDATISSAAMMCGSLEFSTAKMHRPNLSAGHVRQGIQETQMPTMKGSYGDDGLQYPLIASVCQRAVMLNMMMGANRASEEPISQVRSLGEQRQWSAPECLPTFKQERFNATYEAQELDISDSDILGMWLTSKVQEEGEQ
jgi:hypothetical protein